MWFLLCGTINVVSQALDSIYSIAIQVDLESRMKALQDIIVKSSVIEKPQCGKTKVHLPVHTDMF